MAWEVWVVIGSLLSLLVVSIILYYTGGWEAVREILANIRHAFNIFWDSMPNFLKLIFFLFLILTMGSFVMGFFINTNYACTTSGDLRIPHGRIAGGIVMGLQAIFEGYDSENATPEENASWDNFVLEKTYPAQTYHEDSAEGLFYVRCFGTDPRFTLKGLDLFEFKYWVALFLIIGLIRLGVFIKKH